MNGAALITWGSNVPGRETQGIDVFGKAVVRFENLTKEGRVHGHREYFSITGRNGGFMIIEGEVEELLRILAEEETLRINAQASAIVDDFEIEVFAGGTDRDTQQLIGNYVSSLNELGYT
jgi:hypothetical protein